MAISVYRLKPAFVALLRPLARLLATSGVTANQVTAAACLLSILYAVLLACFPAASLLWGLLPVWLFLRMACNALDGIMAREHHQKSRLGALLNEMGDVVADAALFVPLALLLGLAGLLLALPLPEGWNVGYILTAGLCICAALMLRTVYNRLRAALKETAA